VPRPAITPRGSEPGMGVTMAGSVPAGDLSVAADNRR
jgi:hypothetical protein